MSYLSDLFSLDGRRALVTGGSSGIGRAIAEALGRAGASVTILGREQRKLDDTATALGAAGVDVTTVSVDLADRDALARFCASDELALTDIMVTSAGVNLRPPLGATTERDYATTMVVNLEAPYLLGQAVGPRMAERGFGRIINIGSQQTARAFGNSGVYGISKAAVAALSRSQAEAWSASGVTANTLVPGFVVTPMTTPTIAQPGQEAALAARTMIGRNGVPEDFAGVAILLASDAGRFITGQMVAVDGGFSVS